MANEYNNYSDLGIVSSITPENTHLFIETAAGDLVLVNSGNTTEVYKSVDKGDNWTQVVTTYLGDSDYYKEIAYHDRGYSTDGAIWFILTKTDGEKVYGVRLDLSDYSETADLIASWVGDKEAMDIQFIGADIWWFELVDFNGDWYIYAYKGFPESIIASHIYGDTGTYTLKWSYFVTVGTDIYYLMKRNDQNVKIWKKDTLVNPDGFTEMEDLGANTDLPDSQNQRGIAYDGSNIIYFTIKDTADSNKIKLWSYTISTDTATQYGEYNIALMLDRNTASGIMEKAFHTTADAIYQLHPEIQYQLYLISVVDTDAVWIAITDNFVMNNDGDIYERVNMVEYIFEGTIYHRTRDYATMEMKYNSNYISIVSNMLIQIIGSYTRDGSTVADQVIFEGIAQKPTKGVVHYVEIINMASEMKSIRPTGSKAGRSDQIISDINDDTTNNPKYIRDGTLSSGAAMGTLILAGSKDYQKVVNDLADHDNFDWYIRTEGALDYNNGTVDSGADIRYDGSSNLDPMLQVDAWEIIKINKIVVRGAINITTGVPYEGSWDDLEDQHKNGINSLEIDDAELNSNALCTTKATNIGTREIINRTNVQFKYRKTIYGFIQPGQTITFKYVISGYINITEAQYIINGIAYNFKGDIGYIDASSNLVFGYSDYDKELPQQNSQRIEQVSAHVAGMTTLPIGFIAMYSGTWVDDSTIPGWYKCDGNNGTVNLVNKFVRGATTSGGSGGSDDAVVVEHAHDLRIGAPTGAVNYATPSPQTYSSESDHVESTGVSGTNKNIPAYYALIFIQRIS